MTAAMRKDRLQYEKLHVWGAPNATIAATSDIGSSLKGDRGEVAPPDQS